MAVETSAASKAARLAWEAALAGLPCRRGGSRSSMSGASTSPAARPRSRTPAVATAKAAISAPYGEGC